MVEEVLVAAVDVGGTRIKAALVDAAGRERTSLTVPTPCFDRPGALPDTVVTVVNQLFAAARATGLAVPVAACGVVVPGLVDARLGVARYAANLGWRDVEVSAPARDRLGIPVILGHDVRAGLVAEARLGAARGARHALFVPVGTGIAGALMLDGHIIVADGWAGELGHVRVDPEGQPCGCGSHGCLETVASATAIERGYDARRLPPQGPTARTSAESVASRVMAGDPHARAVWDRATAALAEALAAAVSLTGVDLILLGGGLSRSGGLLLDPVRAGIDRILGFHRRPGVLRAALGDRAGCLGAACLARDALG